MAGQALIVTLNGLSGSAESGGKLYSYARSTSTPRALYTDLGLTTPATNPVIADALGTIVSYFDTSLEYSFTAKTADDSVTLWKADIVGGAIALTYVNPDSALSPFIETSWLSRLGSPIPTTIAGWGITDGVRVVSTLSALKALVTTALTTGYTVLSQGRASAGDFGGGVWRWVSGDQSAKLVTRTKAVSSVNTGTDVLTSTAHGFITSQAVIASAADAGLSLNTLYYVRRLTADTFSLHLTPATALANTSLVNITALVGSLSMKALFDPMQALYVTADGAALDGSAGCWVRDWDGVEYHQEWAGVDHTAIQSLINTAGLLTSSSHAIRYRNVIYTLSAGLLVQGSVALNSQHRGHWAAYSVLYPSKAVFDFTTAPDATIGIEANAAVYGAALYGFHSDIDLYRTGATKAGGGIGYLLRGVEGFNPNGLTVTGFAVPYEVDGNGILNIVTVDCTFRSCRAVGALQQALKVKSAYDIVFEDFYPNVASGADRVWSCEQSALANPTEPNNIIFIRGKQVVSATNPSEIGRVSKGFLIELHDTVIEGSQSSGIVTNYAADEPNYRLNILLNGVKSNLCGALYRDIGKNCSVHIIDPVFDDQTNEVSIIFDSTGDSTITSDKQIQMGRIGCQAGPAVSGFCISINNVKGAKVNGTNLLARDTGIGRPTVVVGSGATATQLSNIVSVTTYASTNGFIDNGVSTVITNCVKLAS